MWTWLFTALCRPEEIEYIILSAVLDAACPSNVAQEGGQEEWAETMQETLRGIYIWIRNVL